MNEPTSVEELVEMIWASALDVSTSKDFDTEDKYLKARKNSLAHYSAKINRLIVLAKLEGFDIAFDCHDYDRLRAYKEQLTKELGDSEAEKNSGTWSRL